MTRRRGGDLRFAWLVAGLVLVALNMRPAVTSVGPVIEGLRTDAGLSGTAVGLLTTEPLLAFGLIAPFAPALARRLGLERALAACMVALTAGLALRLAHPLPALFLGTLVAGCGLAIANVLVPALVKRRFPGRAAFVMGMYSIALSASASLAAGLTVPIANWTGGWRVALAAWAIPALLAVLVWLPHLLRGQPAERPSKASERRPLLWRDRLAWKVTIFMGAQSLVFFTTVAWLPKILHDHGTGTAAAGTLLSVAVLAGVPAGLLVTLAASRLRDQRPIALAVAAPVVTGFTGLLVAPTAAPALWAFLLGAGEGAAFTLCLTLMVLRSPDELHTSELSGMAQSVGYTVAAVGPLALGALYDLSGGWTVPLIALLVATLVELAAALGASRPGLVGRGSVPDLSPASRGAP